MKKNNPEIEKYFTNLNKIAGELFVTKENLQLLQFKLNTIYQSPAFIFYKFTKPIISHPYNMIKNIIPITLRKKIKKYLSKIIIFNQKNQINYALKQEWKKFTKKQPQEIKHDIIIFSLISWNFRFQRPQQLATELSHLGHRVFYINNEFIPQRLSRSGFQAINAEKISDNLYQINISSGSRHFIYHDTANSKDVAIMLGSIKTLLNKARIVNPVALIEHPFWYPLAQKLSMPLVYDCMDNHSGFQETSPENVKAESEMIRSTNFNIASSDYLLKYLKRHRSTDTLLVCNGANLSHFQEKRLTPPDDIAKLPPPIIGYYGALANWFDTTLLEKIAQHQPHASIVLIGEVTNKKILKLSYKYPNIKLLGEKPYSSIPSCLKKFDVALIPFKINPLTKATNPVKIFEYFSQGKSVVSTNLPELKKYEKILYLSQNHTEFLKNIDLALSENTSKIILRRQVASQNQWSAKAKQISEKLSSYFPKVSIVILVYNSTQMSKDSIDTVLNRSFYPNKEIIVVDNASKPDTVRMLKKYQNNPEIKLVLNEENYGFAKGNNIGTRLATGEYIVLLNNDILATPGWIERLVYCASKNKIGLVGPITNSIGNEAKIDIEYDHTDRKQMERRVRKYTSRHWGETQNLQNLAAFCWICPKTVYDKIGELDERFGRGMFEDDDYCHRLKKAGYQILCAEDSFIHHFGGASFKQIVSQEYLDLFESNKKKFEAKWKIKWQPHRYRQGL
ncbi:MAG: glycosyltransferase [Patescibacteria group bacterium]